MAKIVNNEKGFKILEISRQELIERLGHLGSEGYCDSCLEEPEIGYYVAVMNRWYCPTCFKNWLKDATYYPEDQYIETRNFNRFKRIFNVE